MPYDKVHESATEMDISGLDVKIFFKNLRKQPSMIWNTSFYKF